VHIVTLSFDDGFERSSIRTAEIFERHGLVAELNVLAAGHLEESSDAWHTKWRKGDFALWNDLQARGHRVMPHGYRHADKTKLPLTEAQRSIERCLDAFTAELEGFEPARASFAFPYNRSTPALEAWLGRRVRAFRTYGDAVMALPRPGQQRIGCAGFGPDRCDDHLVATVDSFLDGPPGWLCYNLHGLDDEGWGPVGSDTLDDLLGRLVARGVPVLPIVDALEAAQPSSSATRRSRKRRSASE
jgi:peptidoglycan/xylan/chitin deacetylase (PgdA/CDA1 family)